jgi:predicted RND superfamily exporter protein
MRLPNSKGTKGGGKEAGGTIIEDLISLVNVRDTTWEGGGLKVAGLLDEWPIEKKLPALREKALKDKHLVGRVVGREGKHSVVILRSGFMDERDSLKLFEHIMKLAKKHDADGFRVMVSGHPAFDATLDSLMLADFRTLTPAATVVMILLSSLVFRHPMGGSVHSSWSYSRPYGPWASWR